MKYTEKVRITGDRARTGEKESDVRSKRRKSTMGAVGGLLLLAWPLIAYADGVLRWRQIVGIIQAGNMVGSGAGQVTGGGQPWVTRRGAAVVNLNSGDLKFFVQGLVLAGGNAIGTPGAVTAVKGTLVCDTTGSATGDSTLVDTDLVPLSPEGDAVFSGNVGPLPDECISQPNIAFLVRVGAGAWIAAGEVRVSVDPAQ